MSSNSNELMGKQVLKRKCTLLKSAKISLESLMFERASSVAWQPSFSSGTLTMFCRHILECLLDGASDGAPLVWSLITAVLGSPNASANNEFKSVRDQMPSTLAPAESYEMVLVEWIFYSLRHHCFLAQLECFLSARSSDPSDANELMLTRCYSSSAFLMDREFVNDFLLYLKAFERNNYGVLSKIKKTVFHLNQQIDECEAFLNKALGPMSLSDSRTESFSDLNSSPALTNVSSSLTTPTVSPHGRFIQQHRRMHSFPNIQINLSKMESKPVSSVSRETNSMEHSTITLLPDPVDTPEKKASVSLPVSMTATNSLKNVPTLAINDHQMTLNQMEADMISSTTTTISSSTSKKKEIFSSSNVFDLIHGVQINCECSPLDKENSHFVIADLAIAAMELIKTASKPSTAPTSPSSPKYLSSASINIGINSRPVLRENVNSFTRSLLNASPKITPRRSRSFCLAQKSDAAEKFKRKSRSFDDVSSTLGFLNDLKPGSSTAAQLPKQASFSLFYNSVDSTSLLTESSFSGSPLAAPSSSEAFQTTRFSSTSRLLKLSSPAQSLDHAQESKLLKSKAVLNRSRTDPSFMNSIDELDNETLTVSTGPKTAMETISEATSSTLGPVSAKKYARLDSQRSRKFSWEEIEDLFSAENIAKALIRRLAKRVSPDENHMTTLPTVLDFEFFIEHMEYYEYLQAYFESKGFLRTRSTVSVGSPETSRASLLSPPAPAKPATGSLSRSSSMAMSASSIYLSHSSASNATVLTQDPFSVSPSFSEFASSTDDRSTSTLSALFSRPRSVVPTLGSSSLKVKSAAYVLGNQALLDQLEKQSSDSVAAESSSFDNFSVRTSLTLSSAAGSPASTIGGGRIIGDELWAPVREQLILNLHPKHKRAEQMATQHYRCADCGIQIRYDKIKTFLYCEYFGKYFCRCCHVSQQSYIPAYVVYLSDYRVTFEVSKKAKNFLEKIYDEPLITLESLNPNLFRDETTIFSKMKRLRTKLYNCRSYLNSCRFSANLKTTLESQFDDFIINDQHVYSIHSLFKLRKSNYYEQFKAIVQRIIEHIRSCELCSQQGYICGFCHKSDLLYPFDFETVDKCPNCLACYHRVCFKTPESCPRCLRKRQRAVKTTS